MDLELFSFIANLTGLDPGTAREIAIVIIALTVYTIGNKLTSGWISARQGKRAHGYQTDAQWREHAEKLANEISDLRERQVRYLLERLETLESEIEGWERNAKQEQSRWRHQLLAAQERGTAEARRWQKRAEGLGQRLALAEAMAEGQRTLIAELEARISHLEEAIDKHDNDN